MNSPWNRIHQRFIHGSTIAKKGKQNTTTMQHDCCLHRFPPPPICIKPSVWDIVHYCATYIATKSSSFILAGFCSVLWNVTVLNSAASTAFSESILFMSFPWKGSICSNLWTTLNNWGGEIQMQPYVLLTSNLQTSPPVPQLSFYNSSQVIWSNPWQVTSCLGTVFIIYTWCYMLHAACILPASTGTWSAGELQLVSDERKTLMFVHE